MRGRAVCRASPPCRHHGGTPSPCPSLRKSLPTFTSLSKCHMGRTVAHVKSGQKNRLFQKVYPLKNKTQISKKFSRKIFKFSAQAYI